MILNHLYVTCTSGRKNSWVFFVCVCWRVVFCFFVCLCFVGVFLVLFCFLESYNVPLHRDHANFFALVIWQVMAACPCGSFRIASVSMQIQGCVTCSVYFGFLNYHISNEIRMSWVLCDNRFLKKIKLKKLQSDRVRSEYLSGFKTNQNQLIAPYGERRKKIH